ITLRGIQVALRYRVERIVAANPDLKFLASAYLVHRLTGIPLYLYLHDTIVEGQTRRPLRWFASLLQPRVLRAARTVFVLSDALEELYRTKYGLSTVVIPHALDDALFDQPPTDPPGRASAEPRIGLTGAIANLNLDARL